LRRPKTLTDSAYDDAPIFDVGLPSKMILGSLQLPQSAKSARAIANASRNAVGILGSEVFTTIDRLIDPPDFLLQVIENCQTEQYQRKQAK
jgi:hypothetical protein